MFENIVSDVDLKKWEKHPRLFTAGDKLPSAATATDEGIERRKFRSNKPYFSRFYYYNLEAARDGIKHWADGIGDTNPLFTNLEYAKNQSTERLSVPARICTPYVGYHRDRVCPGCTPGTLEEIGNGIGPS